MPMKLLLATDGSPAAERAIQEALRVVRLDGAEALVVSVVGTGQRIATNTNAMDDLARAARILEAGGITPLTKVLKGDPADAILEAARHYGPDLVVMGTAGRQGFTGLLAGSVSRKVVAGWSGPVLLTRGEG